MNGTVERSMTWKNLKQRLGFKGMGCLGIKWTSNTQTITILEQQEEEQQQQQQQQQRTQMQLDQRFRVASGMNLATALEVERNLRGDGGENVSAAVVGLPMNNSAGNNTTSTVKSLMMLIEETDGDDWKQKKKKEKMSDVAACEVGPVVWNDRLCCVCMERNKGAAFIPCGHAFCRVCSREVWLNRGSCAVCNRSILQILDIF